MITVVTDHGTVVSSSTTEDIGISRHIQQADLTSRNDGGHLSTSRRRASEKGADEHHPLFTTPRFVKLHHVPRSPIQKHACFRSSSLTKHARNTVGTSTRTPDGVIEKPCLVSRNKPGEAPQGHHPIISTHASSSSSSSPSAHEASSTTSRFQQQSRRLEIEPSNNASGWSSISLL